MADKTFNLILPALKAIDNGDDTHSAAVECIVVPAGGTDTVFINTNPPVKAIDLGDGTFALAVAT